MNVTLTAITMYPVKSIRGISLAAADVEPEGLAGDRRWVIVDDTGTFISQRTAPRLATVRGRIAGAGLVLAAPGRPPLPIEPGDGDGARLQVTVWQDVVDARGGYDRADDWLSTFLDRSCRLAFMDDRCRRPLGPAAGSGEQVVSFADGYPCLLIGDASLADLNGRLEHPLPMDRFRPNLVVTGAGAYAEDRWRRLAIGAAEFSVAGPCARCNVTTVDQATGTAGGPEPLKTLATYRQGPRGVEFGVNLRVERPGRISNGDRVTILG